MRRNAYGLIASGAVLFSASAIGVMGTWAVVTSVLVLTLGALLLAIAMEDATVRPPVSTSAPLRATGPSPDVVA